MGLFSLDLATKGMDGRVRFNILKRHLIAFIRHLTARKLANFFRSELARITKKAVISHYPYILKIEPNNICNLKCAYCYEGRRSPLMGERPYGRMTFEQFKGLVDEVGEYLFKINLYGFGEPFLFADTFDMISYASKKNIGVGVSSNMCINDTNLGQKIVESGLEVLIFSCHGVTQKSYEKFMVHGDAPLAFRNIRSVIEQRTRLVSKTPFVDWQFCVTRFNQDEIDKAKEIAAEIGIDQVRFIRPFFPENAEKEWFSDYFPKEVPSLNKHAKQPSCAWLYRSAYINFDGGLIPCCTDPRKLASDFGNVFEHGFIPVWTNKKYQAARRLVACPQDNSSRIDIVCSTCPITRIDT